MKHRVELWTIIGCIVIYFSLLFFTRRTSGAIETDLSELWSQEYLRQLNDVTPYLTKIKQNHKILLLSRKKAVKKRSNLVIPNVSHYVNIGKRNFTFLQFLSYYSTFKIQNPDYVFLHGQELPVGRYWNILRSISLVQNFYFVNWTISDKIYGIRTHYPQHVADYLRLQILYNYGGQYVDDDVIVLKNFQYYRLKYNCTWAMDKPSLQIAVIVARQHAPFLKLMLENYRNFKPEMWLFNSNWAATKLKELFPHLVMASLNLSRPDYDERHLLVEQNWSYWQQQYSMHVYKAVVNHAMPTSIEELSKWQKNTSVMQAINFLFHGENITKMFKQ